MNFRDQNELQGQNDFMGQSCLFGSKLYFELLKLILFFTKKLIFESNQLFGFKIRYGFSFPSEFISTRFVAKQNCQLQKRDAQTTEADIAFTCCFFGPVTFRVWKKIEMVEVIIPDFQFFCQLETLPKWVIMGLCPLDICPFVICPLEILHKHLFIYWGFTHF